MSHGKLKNRPLWPMRHVRPRPIIPFPVWHSASPPGILQQTSSKVRFNTLNHPTLAKFTQRNCLRQHHQLIYVHFDSGRGAYASAFCTWEMRNWTKRRRRRWRRLPPSFNDEATGEEITLAFSREARAAASSREIWHIATALRHCKVEIQNRFFSPSLGSQ